MAMQEMMDAGLMQALLALAFMGAGLVAGVMGACQPGLPCWGRVTCLVALALCVVGAILTGGAFF